MSEAYGLCRWCRRPAWLLDTDGLPAHPCCARWIGAHGHADCLGCRASEQRAAVLAKRAKRRGQRR